MTGSEGPHVLSAQGFLTYVEAWPTESPDDVSLCKYSISLLLAQAVKLLEQASNSMGVGFALYLRAAALKREYVGASRFIFWSFADAHAPPAPPRGATALELDRKSVV